MGRRGRLAPAPGPFTRHAILAELTFASMESFGASLASPEGQTAAADVEVFATDGADMFISELADS